jgi:hypothetical protein
MPNPVSDILRIQLQNYPYNTIQYKIFDPFGKLITIKEADSELTEIDMGGLPPSWYILEISENKEILKTYKIIKY